MGNMEIRKVQKIVEGTKVTVRMKELKPGDVFTLIDVDENDNLLPDAIEFGERKYVAVGEPFINDEGVWTVEGENC